MRTRTRHPARTLHPIRGMRRRSTKKHMRFRSASHPWRLVAAIAAAIAVVVLALVWGNHLKKQSDTYRADREAGRWTLAPETATDRPVTAPDCLLKEIRPEQDVGPIVIAGSHDGVLLPLRDAAGQLHYRSNIAVEAGLAIPSDAIELARDVARLDKRPLRSAGIYHVSCFAVSDASLQTYLRGLDLALLCEYAASGIDELLLLGLPVGTDAADAQTVAFLEELNRLLSSLPYPPAVGVTLPLAAFAGEVDTDAESGSGETIYAGALSPGRIGLCADYLALDLRDMSPEEIDRLLPRVGYIYQRHGLRMLVDRDIPAIGEDLLSHGFVRVYEMRRDE